jgi:2,4-dienoyl-CoA reductase (NADPH2)
VTSSVHSAGGKIVAQILHAGRYGYHPWIVSASTGKSPISPFSPKAMSVREIQKTIDSFARCAVLAAKAGYDGVELMGSEGYLINQFLSARTNRRQDEWGGSFEARSTLALRIVEKVRDALGSTGILVFRTSLLELVEGGNSGAQMLGFAKQLQARGVDLITSGIGWHEARIPTISTMVPHGIFVDWVAEFKKHLSIPLAVTNRINTPDQGEAILAAGKADMIAMARPLLADPDFVNKAARGEAKSINTCIGCNQACLDHIFAGRRASCLVNPLAAFETERVLTPSANSRRIAVVGGGVAGLAFAHYASQRGHKVELFEKDHSLGGQFRLAAEIPGKADYAKTISYFADQLRQAQVPMHFGANVSADQLKPFDHVVLATGVKPRRPNFPGADHEMVTDYQNLLSGKAPIGRNIAIIGAGGVGFDVAEYVAHKLLTVASAKGHPDYFATWGISKDMNVQGGLEKPADLHLPGQVYLLQRRPGKMGENLNKTTGWALRAMLKKYGVQMISGVEYQNLDERGLQLGMADGSTKLLAVDQVVLCAGSVANRDLEPQLSALGAERLHVIGGARMAAELDAKKALLDAFALAVQL